MSDEMTGNASGDTSFSYEQQAYLVEVLSRLKLHQAFQSGGGSAESEEETVYGTPIDELCKEEVAKYNMHPLDTRAFVERLTDADEMATGTDQFLLRHLGFFNVEPNSPGYMVRMRIPACKLRGDQMHAIADIAENFGGGYSHVTTRGNIQIREVAPRNVLNVLEAFQQHGLSCHGSGADSARNITAAPTAGFDPVELMDLAPYAVRISNRILHTRELQGIPRKFNISFDNGGSISCVSDTNDIAFLAVNVGENPDGVEPGIYCRISLGGITGHKDFARDTGVICKPEETVLVADAMLRVFVEHGDRTNRKRARLKYVLDKHGFDWFIERTQEKLDELETGIMLIRKSAEHDAPRAPIKRQAHIGVHPQKETGMNYVGVALELGRMSPEQMRRIGDLAKQYGKNDVRLTVWQNLLIPHVKDADIAAVTQGLADVGIGVSATAFAAGAVACTGKWGCKLANAHTKEAATQLIRHLESCFTLDTPINIHFTGCPNSCAQHYIGDIGMVGTTAENGEEGYHVVLGGGSDNDQMLARPLCGPIPASELNALIEQVIRNYLERRNEGETFFAFSNRLGDDELSTLYEKNSVAA